MPASRSRTGLLAGALLALLALAPARAEAVPVETVDVIAEPLAALLPPRPAAPARPSAASCLLDREPHRACRAPRAGGLRLVPGTSPRSGAGEPRRYQVQVERGLALDTRAFAEEVEAVLADPRGWSAAGIAFRRVAAGPVDLRVVLAAPETVDRLCRPLRTHGSLSCASEGRAVLNVLRWRRGAEAFDGDLELYRRYLVNHEVGHLLGRGHRSCPRPGARAPVMMQQTKGVGRCRPNGRPLARELG